MDTWGRFSAARDTNDYTQVTDTAVQLKAVADEHDAAVVAVHHTRKVGKHDHGDFLESVLGSTGLAAAADTTLVLRRARGNRDAVLSVTGRDVSEEEFALAFDSHIGTWAMLGTTQEVQESDARQDIVDLLRESGEPMGPKAIAEALEKNRNTVRVLLRKMEDDGAVTPLSGQYTVKPINSVNRQHQEPAEAGQAVYGFTQFTGTEENTNELPIF